MSREIKFRGWDSVNEVMLPVESINFREGYVSLNEGDNSLTDTLEMIELMQYTGLKDKNGKEIYEGDILSIKIYSGDKVIVEGKTVVEFKDGCFGVIWGHDKAFLSLNSFFKAKFEVIGNIYENPELLRGEK
ncbi:MAG: YopX family protein [Clostridium perfringens]|nr:YopX family protein [Clostridium perfringens]